MTDPATVNALRDAIQADMRSRLNDLSDRLEHDVERTVRVEELEQLFEEAFTEVTMLFASGFAARLREARSSSR